MRRPLIAAAIAAALISAAHADTKEDGQLLGYLHHYVAFGVGLRTPADPADEKAALAAAETVSQRELQVGSAVVINFAKRIKAEMKACVNPPRS